jgi:diguanylate cyclase (GGDEF)-like protein
MAHSSTHPAPLSRQVTYLAFLLAAVVIVVLGSFGWWAASRIDDRAIARESRSVQTGLADLAKRMPVEQDTSAIWDDSVVNLRANNDAWLAENLVEWMSEYFGHSRIYILDPQDQLVRAVADGERVGGSVYEADKAAIAPLVQSLRRQMADASAGLDDSTAAITGLGTEDLIVLGNGQPALVSVRPVIPGSDAVQQAPGTEFLHISARFLDQSVADEIARKYEVPGLAFERSAQTTDERIASPVLDTEGRIVGFFTWIPDEPAFALIKETAPAVIGGVILAALAIAMLLRRLRRTSTMLEHSKAEASFLAFHDPMTGIPNRSLFEDRLDQALANMRRNGSRIALHYMDLDRFKHVNDTLGHPAGDELIRQAAKRLLDQVDEVDTVARLGGDEFAVIQFVAIDTAAALALSQKIVDAFKLPFDIHGHEVRVGATIGVVVTTDGEARAEDLMRQADIALYDAKEHGGGRHQLFAGELGDAVRERRSLELDLRAALEEDRDLELVYQPIYHTRSGNIAGAEALVRWRHPVRGYMSPATFIGLAEERGLIDQLGMWVMRKACLFAAANDIPWVAVNVSPVQFRDEWFANRVFDVLSETGLPAKRLEIEITEGLLLQNSPMIQATLMQLRSRGIRVALDDFGTGYSSISYLRSHGVDKLKIDQSFTAQLGLDLEIDSIVRSIIDLGRAMHMAVTAEGVETEEQRQLLKAMGCNQLQGFLLSRPLTPERITEILDAGSAATVHSQAAG